jgi:glucose-1-phosphate thymidylyltransferase
MVLKGLITPGVSSVQLGAAPIDPTAAGLQRVANRPILCHALDRLREVGVREIALVAPADLSVRLQGSLAEEVADDITMRWFIYDHGDYSSAFASAVASVGESPCIVHPPDGFVGQPLAGFVELLTPGAPDLVVLARESPNDLDSIGLASRRLLRLAETGARKGVGLDLTGVCLFGEGALGRAGATDWRPQDESDLAAVAERLVEEGGSLRIGVAEGWRKCTGRATDLLDMNRVALDALEPQTGTIPGERNRIEGTVVVHPSASVQASVIIGPAIVGPGALVVESYIGPYTSIGAHAHIEGAEVERSIILAGASIMHVGGRLVASIVGRDARVARDFSLPRAMRLNVGDGGEVVLC